MGWILCHLDDSFGPSAAGRVTSDHSEKSGAEIGWLRCEDHREEG